MTKQKLVSKPVGINTKLEMITMAKNNVQVRLEAVARAKVLLKKQQDHLKEARKMLKFWERRTVE